MKKYVAVLLIGILALTLLTGFKKAPAKSQIIIGRSVDCLDLDPTTLNDTPSIWTLSILLEGLVKTNDLGTQIVPCLAKSWAISPDGLVYTFHLKPNVKFADDSKVTGKDWIFSFERAMRATNSYWHFACENIKKVEAPNDTTFVVYLKGKSASTLANLAMFNLAVQSKAYYKKVGSYANTAPLGTGLYALSRWTKGQSMNLVKNVYYHEKGYPKTAELVFNVIPDDDSRVMQLRSKSIDIITDVPYSSMNMLKSASNVKTVGVSSSSNRYLVLNTTDSLLSNEKVRKALLYATNKSQLVNTMLYGYGKAAVSYMPQNGLYWNDKIKPVYDINKAKALLKEAGYPKGFDLNFLVVSGRSEYEQIATIIKQQWAQIGVNVNIISMEKASLLDKEYALKFQVLIGSWSDDVNDPDQLNDYLWNYNTSKCFYTGYKNPAATVLYEKAKTELNDGARKNLFFKLQDILYQASPLINLYHSDFTVAMSKSIQGFVQTPMGKYCFENLVKKSK